MKNGITIDIVVIGINVEATLESCLRSIVRNSFQNIRIFYVDGGSTDTSMEIARGFHQVTVIQQQHEWPSPGLQRNFGWLAGNAPFVHFLDSDTVLHHDWLVQGVRAMQNGVGAVRGNRAELYPDASIFNRIADWEWNAAPGECDDFGGDVLIRREALEAANGYDEVLVGGEDPELAQRIRQAGWKIIQLDKPMTGHDLAMKTLRQYCKRAYRTGYGYAAVFARHFRKSRDFWFMETRRVMVRAGGFLILSVFALTGSVWRWEALLALLPALFLLLFPRIFRVEYFAKSKNISREEAKFYAWHCSLAVLPQFFGILRFFAGYFLNSPLKNRRHNMRTEKR